MAQLDPQVTSRRARDVHVGVGINTFGPDGLPSVPDLLEAASTAEEMGFESVWVGDHLLFHVPTHEALTIMTSLAVVTRRITIGSAVLLAVLRPPAWLAKTAGTLDRLAPSRIVLGIGIGGEYPAEFDALAIPRSERGPRTDELIDYLRRAWGQSTATSVAKFYPEPPRDLEPRPSVNAVPLWIGGRSPAAIARAAERGDGWLPAFVSAAQLADGVQEYEHRIRALGHAKGPVAVHLYVRCAPDGRDAWPQAADFLGATYGMNPDRLRRHCLAGTTSEVAEQLLPYVAAGADHLILRPAGTDTVAQLEQLAEVLALLP